MVTQWYLHPWKYVISSTTGQGSITFVISFIWTRKSKTQNPLSQPTVVAL